MKDLLKARFQHNDMAYHTWYDGSAELAEDEQGNSIDFECDTVFARTELGKAFIDWINEELETKLQFESMYFPREYNFEEDQINLVFSEDDFKKLVAWVNDGVNHKEVLDSLIEEFTTTRSGYIAFHSKEALCENLELLMGVMLQAFSNIYSDDFEDYFDRNCIYDSLYKEV